MRFYKLLYDILAGACGDICGGPAGQPRHKLYKEEGGVRNERAVLAL